MRVLVNAANLVKGGALQVAASFISEAHKDAAGIEWHFALSPEVAAELAALGVEPEQSRIFEHSPARDSQTRSALLAFEKELNPDVVFSVFGPAYVRFSAPHLCGVAVGWVTHSTRLAYATLPGFMARLKTLLQCVYKGIWLRFADHWVVEAENARQGMQRRLLIDAKKIDVVPNSCATVFRESGMAPAARPGTGDPVRLLFVSAYYPHKNLEFVPDVAAALKHAAPELSFEFALTMPEGEPGARRVLAKAADLGVTEQVVNVGPLKLPEVVAQYRDAQLCFMPSLLETFSASYPEAMALGRPIVTSDLDFAHAVCGDAAEYFPPNDADQAAQAILRLLGNEPLWQQRLQAGAKVLAGLPDARRKFELYVDSIRATAAPSA